MLGSDGEAVYVNRDGDDNFCAGSIFAGVTAGGEACFYSFPLGATVLKPDFDL